MGSKPRGIPPCQAASHSVTVPGDVPGAGSARGAGWTAWMHTQPEVLALTKPKPFWTSLLTVGRGSQCWVRASGMQGKFPAFLWVPRFPHITGVASRQGLL